MKESKMCTTCGVVSIQNTPSIKVITIAQEEYDALLELRETAKACVNRIDAPHWNTERKYTIRQELNAVLTKINKIKQVV